MPMPMPRAHARNAYVRWLSRITSNLSCDLDVLQTLTLFTSLYVCVIRLDKRRKVKSSSVFRWRFKVILLFTDNIDSLTGTDRSAVSARRPFAYIIGLVHVFFFIFIKLNGEGASWNVQLYRRYSWRFKQCSVISEISNRKFVLQIHSQNNQTYRTL